ncbi:MAG: DNA alkylation repair protein [Flavobacteriaceae bacterium]|nr:DNA alkylation repair protein [Flavobacteriaceae bacterium]
MEYQEVINALHKLANQENVAFKKRKFGIAANNSLGIYQKDLKELANKIGTDSVLASRLFDSGIYEARILASKIFNPKELTNDLLEKWVVTFENWEICDSFCMGLFAKSEFAIPKIIEWSERENEFEKRAAFAIMAAYCMADKKAANSVFENFFPIINREANDDRLYVRKAVNWALRNIGKRNVDLHKKALKTASQLVKMNTKCTKWIGSNAISQLTKQKVNILDYPRAIYRIENQ